MAGNIGDSQTRNGVALADTEVVDVATLTAFTRCSVNRANDFSGGNVYILIADTTPQFIALESAL